jgi:APA family basic amino acid/polyamine antiporter
LRDSTASAPTGGALTRPNQSDRLDLLGATARVVGSIVGIGIFNLPTSLAGYGPITLVRWG